LESLQFDYRPSRYIFSKTLGKFSPSFYWHSKTSCLRYRQMPDPELPNDSWVKVKVKYGGICGSDLNLIFLNDSPATSPYVSFPFTIGHESVGVITQVGENVNHLATGDRVIIDPILSCETRGVTNPCPACLRGDYSLCERMTDGLISPGLLTGTCRDTGGSWSPYLVAHQSQVFQLPDEVDDLNGLMVEPFSCALHSVLRNPPRENDTVLVIGGGVIGICVIAAIRALDFSCKVVALVKHGFQAECASRFGADQVIRLSGRDHYVQALSEELGTKRLKPLFGPEVIEGGADLVYECVGKKQSVNDALRFTSSGGKVVLLGLAGILDNIDWTTVWLNELDVKGSFAYSTDEFRGRKMRTFDIAIELMRSGKVNLSPLVTDRFPIREYRQALTAASKKANGATMKVVFEP
jgi:L-iditol 2-dehydrogenase